MNFQSFQYFQTLKIQILVNVFIGYSGLFKICFSPYFTFKEYLQQNPTSCLGSPDILSEHARRLDIHVAAKPMKSFPSQRAWGVACSGNCFDWIWSFSEPTCKKRRGRGRSAPEVSSTKSFIKKTKIFRLQSLCPDYILIPNTRLSQIFVFFPQEFF